MTCDVFVKEPPSIRRPFVPRPSWVAQGPGPPEPAPWAPRFMRVGRESACPQGSCLRAPGSGQRPRQGAGTEAVPPQARGWKHGHVYLLHGGVPPVMRPARRDAGKDPGSHCPGRTDRPGLSGHGPGAEPHLGRKPWVPSRGDTGNRGPRPAPHPRVTLPPGAYH